MVMIVVVYGKNKGCGEGRWYTGKASIQHTLESIEVDVTGTRAGVSF